MEAGKLHIMMFPWLAFGHIIPYLELAKLIAGKGHRISFISAPRNIDRLPELPPDLSPLITLIKLPLPPHANLPQGAESTTDISYDKVKHLKISYDGLRQPFAQLLRSSSPDWLFFDFTSYWVPTVAAEISIPTAFFFIFNAAFSAFLGPVPVLMGTEDYRTKPEDFTVAPKWIPFKSTLRYLPFEIARIFNDSVSGNDENISDIFRIGAAIKGCDLVLLKSCSEFEPEWFNLLEELHQKPVIPTGLLPVTPDDGSDGGVGWREIKEWLDEQGKGSVVYVAFGSEAKLSQDELTQIANGLELSGLPFFWVLKNLSGLGDGDEQIELPDGLEERTKGRGMVWTSWAPQPKILSHDSVGGFLTHGGWGSLVEGIQFGRVLILLTFLSDQGINARIMEEKKLGYSIPRDELDGSFTGNSVAESLRLVMVEEGGQPYRDKVKEMSRLFGDRDRQDRYVDNLLANLQNPRWVGSTRTSNSKTV